MPASERGPFQYFQAPEIPPPPATDAVDETLLSEEVQRVDFSALAAKVGEETARGAVSDYLEAVLPGLTTATLFAQKGPDGMSLAHAWLGPNLPLFRHSHPRFGDCLYYVLAGEVIMMGDRVLKAGDGFFRPNNAPYKFRAGPQGCEFLEFRAGGGVKGQPWTKLHETSLETLQELTRDAKDHQAAWGSPPPLVSAGPIRDARDRTDHG
jgi:hypothetical protein